MNFMYKILFFYTMILGTLLSISAMSWITAWMGLEINLLSLMPLMKKTKNMYSSESTIKYFIIQAMSSALILFSVIIFFNKYMNSPLEMFSSIFISSALFMKLGAAPFHFWMPEVISGLNWNIIFIIFTWQKIAPMILLSYCMKSTLYISTIIISSSIISGLQGMNQTCIRKILTYSSINHTGWMVGALMMSIKIWLYYFIIYMIINFNIIMILKQYKIYFMSHFYKLFNFNKKLKFFYMLNFLSLAGLPPFLGFLPKWLTINYMILNYFYTLATILIIFTLMTLYFYLQLSFTTLTLYMKESIVYSNKNLSYTYIWLNFLSLSSLSINSMLINFY